MVQALWGTPSLLLLLVVVAVASAGPSLSTRYDESAGRIQILATRDGREIEVGDITVNSDGRSTSPLREMGENGDSFHFGDSKIVFSQDRAGRCLNARQWVNTSNTVMTVCQRHLRSHVYGGPEAIRQTWPIENDKYNHFGYVTDQTVRAAVAVRYWLFSDGRFIHLHSNVPLFIDQNTDQSEKKICFIAENKAPYPEDRQDNVLRWDLCLYDDAKQAHKHAVESYLGKPTGIPDEGMVSRPVWGTSARYRNNVNDEKVRDYAKSIIDNGFEYSNIVISDKWETCYGSLTVDTDLFPNMRGLVDDLHAQGFKVLLQTHPFVNRGCEPFYSEAWNNGYFVRSANGTTLTSWWEGRGGAIDVTNPEAVAWWTNRLLAIQNETGVDSFKFEGGENTYLPQVPNLTPKQRSPVAYADAFAKMANQFGPLVESRLSVESQRLPIFIGMDDVFSTWSWMNGIKTLIPKLLQMNIVGHPFVLPELIGGSTNHDIFPSAELFVRWLQATVFMPVVKYSITPWDFDDETLEISRTMTDLHAKYAPRIVELMKKAVDDGTPVNLPIWWIDPTDATALTVDSEYLLGEDLLVAPVINSGAVTRDIYLPKGSWRDEVDPEHPVIQGPRWLLDYPAPLDTLPYFTRVAAS